MTIVPNFQTVVDPQKLEKLAEVAIKVGLRLEKGQDLVITAPIAALPLVRLITKHAYMAGAGIVTTFYSDEETTLARYEYAPDGSFDKASGWLYDGMAQAYANGAARLAISGDNPMMLSGQDPAKVARANKAKLDYAPVKPKFVGRRVFKNVDLATLARYIDWGPFFQTWDLAGPYPAILTDDVVGEAAIEAVACCHRVDGGDLEGRDDGFEAGACDSQAL